MCKMKGNYKFKFVNSGNFIAMFAAVFHIEIASE